MSDSQQTLSSPPEFGGSNVPPAPPVPPVGPAPLAPAKNTFGLVSLIVGAVAFVGAFIPIINYVSGFAAIAGLVFGIIAVTRKGKPKGLAKGGIAASAVALLLSIVLAIVYTIGFVAAVNDAQHVKAGASSGDSSGNSLTDPTEVPSNEGEVGTRTNPAPIGTTIATTANGEPEYEITLGAPTLNADVIVAAENQFNDAAPAGMQYAMLPITVTYRGTKTGTPWMDLDVSFVSAAGTTHSEMDSSVVGPAPLSDINELYPAGTATGNVVIAIPTADAATGTWVISQSFSDEKFYSAAQ
ncbi:DUF4190 domain-containing protein [Cryobacterium algoricola]|uniref:DUF4190 domain-containing protein n=1 Tax=Cryobacterium algoricola TaxID=1259183 RepID=A0ABY2IJF4_9MICO|nr:DUF4190 domain-containing protein [Cryobacterium algoricola]TFB90866.1 DUF4190 domain-containing protein [Cryobacterium algoricola]